MARSTSRISVVNSYLSEKTYRRHFLKSFNFPEFNQYFLELALNPEHTVIAVIDCSFFRKSGKETDGKAYFYNGVAGKSEQGLEISVISIVEIETRLSNCLTADRILSRATVGKFGVSAAISALAYKNS